MRRETKELSKGRDGLVVVVVVGGGGGGEGCLFSWRRWRHPFGPGDTLTTRHAGPCWAASESLSFARSAPSEFACSSSN